MHLKQMLHHTTHLFGKAVTTLSVWGGEYEEQKTLVICIDRLRDRFLHMQAKKLVIRIALTERKKIMKRRRRVEVKHQQ